MLRIKKLHDHVAEAKAKLEQLSMHDELTGLYNYRYLHPRMNEEFKRAELGQPGHLQLGIRVDGAAGDTRLARGVFRDDFVGPAALLFDRSGWGVGGRLLVPWGRSISTEVGSDVDLSEKRWLSSSAAAAYRHPCRCLSVALFGSRRLGRRGFDLGVNLELVPR
jgi:hypothetical protein